MVIHPFPSRGRTATARRAPLARRRPGFTYTKNSRFRRRGDAWFRAALSCRHHGLRRATGSRGPSGLRRPRRTRPSGHPCWFGPGPPSGTSRRPVRGSTPRPERLPPTRGSATSGNHRRAGPTGYRNPEFRRSSANQRGRLARSTWPPTPGYPVRSVSGSRSPGDSVATPLVLAGFGEPVGFAGGGPPRFVYRNIRPGPPTLLGFPLALERGPDPRGVRGTRSALWHRGTVYFTYSEN